MADSKENLKKLLKERCDQTTLYIKNLNANR